MKNEVQKKKSPGKSILKTIRKILVAIPLKVYLIIIVCLMITSASLGIKTVFFTDSKTTKLGFEDIGELSTQAAYSSTVAVADKERDLFGVSIPFTQSKYVYSYDTVIKAGINFSDVDVDINEITKKIKITLPEVIILSNEINYDSFKVYHESESIFTHFTLEENNKTQKQLQETAKQTAVDNGLLENARENAQSIILGFIEKMYDLDEYDVTFS